MNAAPAYFEPAATMVTWSNKGTASGSPAKCQSYVQRRITWSAANPDDGNCTSSIEMSTEQAPTTYTTVATNLLSSQGGTGWLHEQLGLYEDVGGTPRYWTYRVWAVKIADGSGSG